MGLRSKASVRQVLRPYRSSTAAHPGDGTTSEGADVGSKFSEESAILTSL